MRQSDRVKLHFGPYKLPRLRARSGTTGEIAFPALAGYPAGMPTSDQIFAVPCTEGFIHGSRIVYAIQYDLENPPPQLCSTLIVWLTPEGDATAPWIQPAYAGKRIVTTKPGEHIRYKGELRKVAGVSIYRALPLRPAALVGGKPPY